MTSRSFIVEKTSTLLNEMIHIMPEFVVHLHCHQNKAMPFMKPFILMDLSNGVKFQNYTCWLTNDIQSYHFLHWVSNHHISNEDLVLSNHVKINS